MDNFNDESNKPASPVNNEPSSPSPRAQDMENSKGKQGKKGWMFGLGCAGCGLVGCLGSVVLLVVIIFGGIFWLSNNLLSSTPLDMPPAYLSEDQAEKLEEKMNRFDSKLKESDGEKVELTLTAEEFNYIFQKGSEESDTRMHVDFREDGSVKFMMSVPSEGAKQASEAGRMYLNIVGEGKISAKQGEFQTDFTQLSIGKLNVPGGEFLTGFSQGLAKEIDTNEVYQKLDFRVIDLEIDQEQIYLSVEKRKGTATVDTHDEPDFDDDDDDSSGHVDLN